MVMRPELESVLVNTDAHSPARYRVNGSVSNTPAFAEAFACPAGTPMHPAERCTVW
jgi:predicted metalloendopeptidase